MKKRIYHISTLFVLITISSFGQSPPIEKGLQTITTDAIKAQLGFLASDWTEGREAGEKGEYLAADYIASILQLSGVKPAGDMIRVGGTVRTTGGNERSYFQNFTLLKTAPGDLQVFKVRTAIGNMDLTTDYTSNVDFVIRTSDRAMEADAPVVFAGYGFISTKLKYNDFCKIDVKGKFILKVAGVPKLASESLSASELNAAAREVETTLRSMGAAGIIEVNPRSVTVGPPERKDFTNMSPSEGNPHTGKPYASYSIPGKTSSDNLIRVTVSVKTANDILKGTGITVDDFIRKSVENEQQSSAVLSDKRIYIKTTVKTSQVAVRNVVGVIEGNDPDQVIVLGAHYDHMGIGNGYIWNGADDNGSGTVGIMTLARAIIATGEKPQKTILVALWTAEEEGLLGSRYWIQNPTYPLNKIRLNLNFDMISRYISEGEQKRVTMTYTDKYPGFRDLTVTNLNKYGIDLIVDYQPSPDPPGGSDHRSFVAAGIPVMRFKPGHREEYHTPGDGLETVDWDIMEKIIRISFANIWELANSSW